MNKRTIGAPVYKPGQVLDISYRNGGLPNRIRIELVSTGVNDSEWMYAARIESMGDVATMSESFVRERAICKDREVYKLKTIVDRYARGWRFCGNYPASRAKATAEGFAKLGTVKNVRITEAYNAYGSLVGDQLAIWIRYHSPIDDDGRVINSADIIIDVK